MGRTLVIGASLHLNRYSNLAMNKLMAHGEEVLAFGNEVGEVKGIKIETEKIQFRDIDTVTLYLNPKKQRAYYDYILSLRPKRVIFNPGTENPDFYQILEKNNVQYEVACTLVLLATNQY